MLEGQRGKARQFRAGADLAALRVARDTNLAPCTPIQRSESRVSKATAWYD